MADEFYRAGLKEMLKQYFFNIKQVRDEYPVLDPGALGTFSEKEQEYFQARSDAAKAAREYAFNRFFERIQQEPILDAEGNPYPMDKNGKVDFEKVAYDFFLDKPVIFKGIDPHGMVKVGFPNKTINNAYRQLLVNSKGEVKIDPDKGKIHLDIQSTNYNLANSLKADEYSEDVRVRPESVPKPKKLGWWNKIVKTFTGHSCKAWKEYDKAQQIILSEKAVTLAQNHAQINNVLSDENINKDYRHARIDKMKDDIEKHNFLEDVEDPKAKVEEKDITWRKDMAQTIMDNFIFKNGKFELKSAEEKLKAMKEAGKEKQARENLKAQNVEKKEAPKEVKEDPKVEVPKEPEKPLKDDPCKEKRVAGGRHFRERMLDEGEKEYRVKYLNDDTKGNHGTMIDKVKKAYVRIEAFADPNKESDMTKEQLANDLATVYLGSEMYKNIKNRIISEDGDPKAIGNEYRTALEGLQGKHGLHKALVDGFLNSAILDDAMKHPEHLNDYVLNGEASFKQLSKATEQIMGKNVVDVKAQELFDAQLEKDRYKEHVEQFKKEAKVEKPEVAKVEQPTVKSI